MIEIARPGLLLAGALLAAVPLALHFFRPRERKHRLLPTTRFLTPASRTRLAVHRRPDHPLLLALRMGLCVALGAAFSGMSWVGSAQGTGYLVVVDGGDALSPVWTEAREAAFAGLSNVPTWVIVVQPREGSAPRVERVTGGWVPSPAEWNEVGHGGGPGSGSNGVGGGEVRLAHLLRALRDEAAQVTGVDSLTARLVTRPHWHAWGPGLPELRDELWPAAVELIVPEGTMGHDVAGDPMTSLETVRVEVQAPEELQESLRGSLELLGLSQEPSEEESSLLVRLQVGPATSLEYPWTVGDGTSPETAAGVLEPAFLLRDGRTIPGAGSEPEGTPVPEATVPLLRIGGRPAAGAIRGTGRCDVAFPLEPGASLATGGELVLVLEALLADGCGVSAGPLRGANPDEVGARDAFGTFLEGGDRPTTLEAGLFRDHRAGLSLTRLLLATALVLAGLELLRLRYVGVAASSGGAERREPDSTTRIELRTDQG